MPKAQNRRSAKRPRSANAARPAKTAATRNAPSSYFQRAVGTRDQRPRVLIVCEGVQTEPNYFRAIGDALRLSVSVQVEGQGDNTVRVVEAAIALRDAEDYDQVWCVFDRDSFPAGRFNRAIQLAQSNDIRVAYSNEAFELWYILHFEYLNTGLPRDDYGRRLSRHLGTSYRKNSARMYETLLVRQPDAIRNSRRLLAVYEVPNPEQDNPSTTVHELVSALNAFGAPES